MAQLFFCEFWETFKSTVFTEHFWTTASVTVNLWSPFKQSLLSRKLQEIYLILSIKNNLLNIWKNVTALI